MRNFFLPALVTFSSVALVITGLILATMDDFATVDSMKKNGFPKGLPIICHGGMWGDLFIISSVMGLITYFCKWSPVEWMVSAVFAYVASSLLHRMYAKTTIPEAHAHGGNLTAAGKVHMTYMFLAFTVIGLFYFRTPEEISQTFIILVSVALFVHVFLGTHLVLGMVDRYAHFDWVAKDYLCDENAWITVVFVGIFLCGRCLVVVEHAR
jgi:hypothetical protein